VATLLDVEGRFPRVPGYRESPLLLAKIGKTGWHEQSLVASLSPESFRETLPKLGTSLWIAEYNRKPPHFS
jgi:hypothetical protein